MPIRVKNIAAGFVDSSGIFHPIRKSSDYDPDRSDGSSARSDGRGGAKGKRTGQPVRYRSPAARSWARALASEAGRKGAAARKRYSAAKKRVAKKKSSTKKRRNPAALANPKSPLTQQWKAAKVRKTKSGDIQVMIPLKKAVKSMEVAVSGAVRRAGKTVRRLAGRKNPSSVAGWTWRNFANDAEIGGEIYGRAAVKSGNRPGATFERWWLDTSPLMDAAAARRKPTYRLYFMRGYERTKRLAGKRNPTDRKSLKETIKSINWSYGYGDVKSISYGHGGGIVTIKRPYMSDSKRRYSTRGDTVTFAGHSRKFAKR